MIQPLGNRVLVKRAEAKTTKGGLFLPDSAQEKPKMGEVIAAGPGKIDEDGKLQPMNVQTGDKILFSTYAGIEVKTEDLLGEYLIVSEDDILAIIEGA